MPWKSVDAHFFRGASDAAWELISALPRVGPSTADLARAAYWWCRPLVDAIPVPRRALRVIAILRHVADGRSDSWAKRALRCENRSTDRRRPRQAGVDMASKAEKIVAGLGGLDNIEEVEGCITRLRTEVVDASLVDEAALKAAGAHGVVKMGTAIQVVIGTDADPIAADIEDMM
ncbi:glucose PTS transporter subunit EIIB [Streptomyces sp. NPDC017993]|uniref:glucose PTS transporter subunit EIIB n=1 Tax=Streptomyces sp. NPDC017993 TaxID=3365027 RepID=UPI0037AA0D74